MQDSPSGSTPPVDDFLNQLEPRRGFLTKATAVLLGGITGLFPTVVGLATFANPLRKSVKARQRPSGSDADGFFRVTMLEALSHAPQTFAIIADRKDAWNTFPRDAIGSISLQRVGDAEVRAFNVTCPHAGCAVDYRPGVKAFVCPCHNSQFALDGTRAPASPSARDLDSLEYKIVDGVVFVKYQDFQAGHAEKKPS